MGIVNKPLPVPSFDDTLDTLRGMSEDVTEGLEDVEEAVNTEPPAHLPVDYVRDKVEEALSTLYSMQEQIEYLKEERLRLLEQGVA